MKVSFFCSTPDLKVDDLALSPLSTKELSQIIGLPDDLGEEELQKVCKMQHLLLYKVVEVAERNFLGFKARYCKVRRLVDSQVFTVDLIESQKPDFDWVRIKEAALVAT